MYCVYVYIHHNLLSISAESRSFGTAPSELLHHPTDTTLLQHQLQSALAKLSLLEQELANIKHELADKITETGNKTHELEQKSREIAMKDRQFATNDQEFERVLRSFNEAEDSKRRAGGCDQTEGG